MPRYKSSEEEASHIIEVQSGRIADVRPTTPRGESRLGFGLNQSARGCGPTLKKISESFEKLAKKSETHDVD